MREFDLIVVGGGCAGISAALAAQECGVSSILIVERDISFGGILNQCIHRGFGLAMFGESLTGPEFADKLISKLYTSGIEILSCTAVLDIADGEVTVSSPAGYKHFGFRSLILACGCREKPIGALPVSGTRPSGIFTAGQAQKMINVGKMDIGNDILILGSGDVGMIVARRLKILGRHVIAIIEKNTTCGGLESNRISCLENYHIPLLTGHTITRIYGASRISGVDVKSGNGAITHFSCKTLITSVGLVPELELLSAWSIEKIPDGVFLCGNCRCVHPTADAAAMDGAVMGKQAAMYLKTGASLVANAPALPSMHSDGVICTDCPHQCRITILPSGKHGGICGKYK